MFNPAKKVVIVTEKLLLKNVVQIIHAAGGTGYTVIDAGGEGHRGVRAGSMGGHGEAFANVKIEVITARPEVAREIVTQVVDRYFGNFAGIAYVEDVEVVRSHQF